MASKEDILEQLVEEYLIHRGYFVRHNIKFLPRREFPGFTTNQHSNHSDIDVLAFDPKRGGAERVIAVSCKSWQDGFNPDSTLAKINGGGKLAGKPAWKSFRELVQPIWADAFVSAVEAQTGQKEFTYVTAVTKLIGSEENWVCNEVFKKNMLGNPLKILSLTVMLDEVLPALTTTIAGTELGRTLQLFKAAGKLR